MPSRKIVGHWHADAHAESCSVISHMLYIFIVKFRVSTGQGVVKFCNPFRISGIRSWTWHICCGGFDGVLLWRARCIRTKFPLTWCFIWNFDCVLSYPCAFLILSLHAVKFRTMMNSEKHKGTASDAHRSGYSIGCPMIWCHPWGCTGRVCTNLSPLEVKPRIAQPPPLVSLPAAN